MPMSIPTKDSTDLADFTALPHDATNDRVSDTHTKANQGNGKSSNVDRDTLDQLLAQNRQLTDELENERATSLELRKANDALCSEVDLLSQQLFETANTMVSAEAEKRMTGEKMQAMLQHNLEETERRLSLECAQLAELRQRLEHLAVPTDHTLTTAPSTGSMQHVIASLPSHHPSASLLPGLSTQYKAVSSSSMFSSQLIVSSSENIDARLFSEFSDFIEQTVPYRTSSPSALLTLPLLKRTMEQDIEPCLRLPNMHRSTYRSLLTAVVDNHCIIEALPVIDPPDHTRSSSGDLPITQPSTHDSSSEPVPSSTPPLQSGTLPTVCQVCLHAAACPFRYKLDQRDVWQPLDVYCRDRLVAICDFFTFIRHIQNGFLHHQSPWQLYYTHIHLRRQIFYARLGVVRLYPPLSEPVQRTGSLDVLHDHTDEEEGDYLKIITTPKEKKQDKSERESLSS